MSRALSRLPAFDRTLPDCAVVCMFAFADPGSRIASTRELRSGPTVRVAACASPRGGFSRFRGRPGVLPRARSVRSPCAFLRARLSLFVFALINSLALLSVFSISLCCVNCEPTESEMRSLLEFGCLTETCRAVCAVRRWVVGRALHRYGLGRAGARPRRA